MRSSALAPLLFGLAVAAAGCLPGDSNVVGSPPIDASADVGELVCTPACSASQRCVNGACIGEGIFRTTLTWNIPGDLDLHMVLPSGQTISFRNRSAGGGTLDRDDTTGIGPENIFWTAAPPAGDYVVCVIPYNISATTSFRLDIRHPTLGVISRQGMRSPSGKGSSATCSRTSPFFVEAFTIGGSAPTDGGADDVPATLPDVPVTPPDVPVGLPDVELPDVSLPDITLPTDDAGTPAD